MLLAHITFNIPYVILSVLPKLKQMNKFSYGGGAGPWEPAPAMPCSMILPAVMPGVVTGAPLAFTPSLDDFTISYFTTSPLQTRPLLIYSS